MLSVSGMEAKPIKECETKQKQSVAIAICPTCGFKGARYWAPDANGTSRLYCRHDCCPRVAEWRKAVEDALAEERRIRRQNLVAESTSKP